MSKRKPKKSRKKSKPSRKRREAQAKKISVRELQSQQRSRIQQSVSEQRNRLSTWYLSKSTPVKIALGLIVIPLIIALFLLQGVILPFLVTAWGLSKIVLIWLKGPAFIVYISYDSYRLV